MFFYDISKLDAAMNGKHLQKVKSFCKELSDTFHWNIEARTDGDDGFCWIYKNDKLIQCASDYDVSRNCDIVLDRIERAVRSTL